MDKEEEALRIEHVVERGEALYSCTAAEGREIIRQQLWFVPTDSVPRVICVDNALGLMQARVSM